VTVVDGDWPFAIIDVGEIEIPGLENRRTICVIHLQKDVAKYHVLCGLAVPGEAGPITNR